MNEPRIVHDGVVGPVDALQVPRFAGHSTFARLPRVEDLPDFEVAMRRRPVRQRGHLPTGRARSGRRTSVRARACCGPTTRRSTCSRSGARQVVDAGDVAVNPFDIEEAIEQVQTVCAAGRDPDAGVVTIGGDHTIALPALR